MIKKFFDPNKFKTEEKNVKTLVERTKQLQDLTLHCDLESYIPNLLLFIFRFLFNYFH